LASLVGRDYEIYLHEGRAAEGADRPGQLCGTIDDGVITLAAGTVATSELQHVRRGYCI
jgi:hypothetical protein